MSTDLRDINNTVCQSFQAVLQQYQAHAHPLKRDHDALIERAKECLLALDGAALSDPESYVQAAILYDNCKEIEEAVRDAKWQEKDDEDNWVDKSMGAFDEIKPPGQTEDWDDKYDAACEKIRQEFYDQNLELSEQLESLRFTEEQLNAELDQLKSEKKAQGFFNFSGKREVKQRMAPVKQQRKDIQKQMREIDHVADDYIEQRIKERADGFIRLHF